MDSLFGFLKKHMKATIIICAAVMFLIVGVPLIINWLFSVHIPCKFLRVEWDANDVLGYYGSVLGFLSTVVFSGLALWQNQRIQDANSEHTRLLEEMERVKNAPRIIVSPNLAYGHGSNIHFSVKNIAENLAEKIYVSGFAIVDQTGRAVWRKDIVISIDHLTQNQDYRIALENPPIEDGQHRLVFDLKYCDMFGEEYECKVVGIFSEKSSLPKFRITELKK